MNAQVLQFALGSVVRVSDEDWLLTSNSPTSSGSLVKVQGQSELVRDTEDDFDSDLDAIEVAEPSEAKIVADDSALYRRSRLFLETTLRKTPYTAISNVFTVSTRMHFKKPRITRKFTSVCRGDHSARRTGDDEIHVTSILGITR